MSLIIYLYTHYDNKLLKTASGKSFSITTNNLFNRLGLDNLPVTLIALIEALLLALQYSSHVGHLHTECGSEEVVE